MIKVNGQEVKVLKNSLNISDAIEERTTASFTVIDWSGVYYQKGHSVEVWNDTELLFAGVIDKPKRSHINGVYYHQLACKDWHYLADKRIYAGGHENVTAGSIVRTVLQSKLSVEGITEGLIEDGPLIVEARFNYAKVTDCLDSLAEKAGYWWMIDEYKKLHFVPKSTYQAPFAMSNSDMEKGSIFLEIGNPKYRNRQYIKGGTDITDPQTETKLGDGEAQSFLVGFKVAKVPTVKVNDVVQTVGIRGLDEGKQFYWSKGSNVINQDNNAIPLSATDGITITYQGEFDIVALSEIPEEIQSRKDLEGNSGIIEDVADDMDITSRESAFQSANAKLEKYGVIGRRLRFKTWVKGLEVGQLLTVNIPFHNLNNAEMLIESISVTRENNIYRYNVTCVEGPINGSWAKLFHAMATRGQAFIIRENIREDQVLILLQQFSKTWSENELDNIFRKIYPGDVALYPGTWKSFPSFENEDRVKYIAWFDANNVELGRKRITKQTITDLEVNSTTYLAPFEANVSIAQIGWIGGWRATDELGTGIIVDQQIYEKAKTSLEAIQIDKKDIKGW